ncbi:SLC16A12 [Acanthosepion pharaonis]|uniref:SLC16A12 n=1 Tax=Acanthosepion pharaonis TaxID=158019 RepID=A0A812CTJ5_ACAPH|nr:SLC16A12 [Sepia pharaonis]
MCLSREFYIHSPALMEQTGPSNIERQTNEVEPETDPDAGDSLHIPDGGWGWAVCFAGFMVNFTIVGLVYSNGIVALGIITIYDSSISKTTMVGSIFIGVVLCAGPFVLLLMMFNVSHRQVIICGGFVSAVATAGSFFVDQVEVLYLTYGILSGIFAGMSYFSSNTIVGSYFKKKRTLAVGISQSGTGIGAFVLNNLLERSISFYGMRGTFLIISGLFLNIVVYGTLCRPLKIVNMKDMNANNLDNSENPGHSANELPTNMIKRFSSKCTYLHKIVFDLDVMKNTGMQLLLTVYFFWSSSEKIYVYLPAKVVNVGLTREQGALIMSIIGAIIGPSQIITGILGDVFHIPISYLLMPSLFGLSATTLAFTFCNSFSLFALCASIFAIFYGVSFTLRMVLVASILGGRNLTKGYSPLCLLVGLTFIIDSKIAGSLFDATQSYDSIFYFTTGSLFIACIVSSGIICLQRNGKFHDK